MGINEVRFDCRPRREDDGEGGYEDGVLAVVPVVDGVPLTALVDGFETAAGMQPAGDAYGGLVPEVQRAGAVADRFLGRPDGTGRPRTAVLGCVCGDVGCWPLMARIVVTADLVVWDSFEQPHRPGRDYTGFGPFRFERGRYEDALRVLAAQVDSWGDGTPV